MKFTLARPRQPRNPFVAPALLRRAGSHGSNNSAERQRGQRQLAKELQHAMSRTGRAEHAPPEAHSP
jgi:hypothetical protein